MHSFNAFLFCTIFLFAGRTLAQTVEKTVAAEFLEGTWSPVTYDRVRPDYLWLQISDSTWMTYTPESGPMNIACPFRISGNGVRVVCDELEQTHYALKRLTETELVADIFYMKPNGKLKVIRRNARYARRA
jgi:hypothetical protein